MTDFVAIRCVFQAPNTPKLVFGRGSAPDRAGGAYDAPPDRLVGWGGGDPLPIHSLPPRRLRRLDLGASGVRPPQHKFLATPMDLAPPKILASAPYATHSPTHVNAEAFCNLML